MKLRGVLIAFLCMGLTFSLWIMGSQANAETAASEQEITVLNPMGTPPPIQAKKMAPTLKTLKGKTIYFVNTGFIGTDRLMGEMINWFKIHYPDTKVVYRKSKGGMTRVDKALWAEIAKKGDAVVIGLGH